MLGEARVDRESWRWQWLHAWHGPVVVEAVRAVAEAPSGTAQTGTVSGQVTSVANGSAVAAAGTRDGETLCRRKPS